MTAIIILVALFWLFCGYAAVALFWGDMFQLAPSLNTTAEDMLMSSLGVVLAPVPVIVVPVRHCLGHKVGRWIFLWDWPRWLLGYRRLISTNNGDEK